MKRKRLTIIFFSVTALVATPQAMNYFNSYASAVHQEAEARWLQFLVSFGSPTAAATTPSPEIAQRPTICATPCPMPKGVNNTPPTAKSRGSEKINSRPTVAKNRTLEFTFTETATAALDLLKRSHLKLDDVRYDESPLVNASQMLASPVIPAAPNHNGTVKYRRTLFHSTRFKERNAAKAFEKDLNGLVKAGARMVPALRVKVKSEPVAASEPAPYAPDQIGAVQECSAEAAMR